MCQSYLPLPLAPVAYSTMPAVRLLVPAFMLARTGGVPHALLAAAESFYHPFKPVHRYDSRHLHYLLLSPLLWRRGRLPCIEDVYAARQVGQTNTEALLP